MWPVIREPVDIDGQPPKVIIEYRLPCKKEDVDDREPKSKEIYIQ